MNHIAELINYLNIDKDEINSLCNIEQRVDKLFNIYTNKVYYDTTLNFLNNVLYYESGEACKNIINGWGCSCQELHFVFKDILKSFNISSRIIHGDIIDYKVGIIKKMYSTSIIVVTDKKVIHMDLLRNFKLVFSKKIKKEYFKDIIIDNELPEYYSVDKISLGNVMYSIKYYVDIDEYYRINRLIENYNNCTISPFGIIAPFYWGNHPEKKIFYQPLKDVIRIYSDNIPKDFDILEWENSEESSWLTRKQKNLIKKCISIISLDIDKYLQISIIENNFEFL